MVYSLEIRNDISWRSENFLPGYTEQDMRKVVSQFAIVSFNSFSHRCFLNRCGSVLQLYSNVLECTAFGFEWRAGSGLTHTHISISI